MSVLEQTKGNFLALIQALDPVSEKPQFLQWLQGNILPSGILGNDTHPQHDRIVKGNKLKCYSAAVHSFQLNLFNNFTQESRDRAFYVDNEQKARQEKNQE